MIKAVIFDLDGTLVHLPLDYSKLRRKLKIETGNLLEEIKKSKDRKDVFSLWTGLELDAFIDLEIKEGGMILYEIVAAAGFKRGLITLQGSVVVGKICGMLGLSFNSVITREIALSREKQLIFSLKALGAEKEETLFIADRENDRESAMSVGCKFLKVDGNE